jgi:hypothetical protein
MANPFKTTENKAKPNTHVEKPTHVPVADPAPVAEEPKSNPLAGMNLEKPTGKSYAVYLDVDLVEEIDRLAKVNKTNRSKIINLLLRDQIKKLND